MWIETQGKELVKIGEEDLVRVEDGKLLLCKEIFTKLVVLSEDGERAFGALKNAISHNDTLVSFYVDQGRRS